MGFIFWSTRQEHIILEIFPIKFIKNVHANNNYWLLTALSRGWLEKSAINAVTIYTALFLISLGFLAVNN